jgi:putative transposase
VDTLGLVLNVVVSEANLNDRLLMPWLLRSAQASLPRLRLIWADGGYRNDRLTRALYQQTGIRVEIVKRPPNAGLSNAPSLGWVTPGA